MMAEDKRQNEIIRIQKKRNNFVMMDKGFLDDDRLSFKAKGILAYLLGKPDNWKIVTKDLINHSADGRDSIYSGLKELKKYGYYSKRPIRNEKGVVTHWDSIIFEDPAENPENTASQPITGFPDMDNPDTAFPDTEKAEHNNNYINNNDLTNIQSSQSQSRLRDGAGQKAEKIPEINLKAKEKRTLQNPTPDQGNGFQKSPYVNSNDTYDYTTYKTIIQDNIEYDHILKNNPVDIDLVDELVNCMLDVICTKGDTVMIGGEEKNREMVKAQYLKINAMDIEHILTKFKDQSHSITKIGGYLKTMLYTVKPEVGHFYTNAVRVDRVHAP